MKRSDHHRRPRVPFKTLKELRDEKFRLQREIFEAEEGIKDNYHSLVDALTFRNIINTIAEEIIAANLLVSQAYSIIRPLFNRKKKKKETGSTGTKEERRRTKDVKRET